MKTLIFRTSVLVLLFLLVACSDDSDDPNNTDGDNEKDVAEEASDGDTDGDANPDGDLDDSETDEEPTDGDDDNSDGDVSEGDSDLDSVDGDSDTQDGDEDEDNVPQDCIFHDDCPLFQSCNLELQKCYDDPLAEFCEDAEDCTDSDYHCNAFQIENPENAKCIRDFCLDEPYLCFFGDPIACEKDIDCPLYNSCHKEYGWCRGNDDDATPCFLDNTTCIEDYTCIIRPDTTVGRCTPDGEYR